MGTKRKNSGDDWLRKIALKEEEVMELFGISKTTISRFRRERKIPYCKVGGSYFYQPKALKQMLKDNTIPSDPPDQPPK